MAVDLGWRAFGYRDGNDLDLERPQLGRIDGDEIYAPDGRYLGELLDGRLITHRSKRGQRRSIFAPHARRVGYAKYSNYAGYRLPTTGWLMNQQPRAYRWGLFVSGRDWVTSPDGRRPQCRDAAQGRLAR
jgi:hypothetical protein